jgi:hypothetical protein
MSVSDGQSVNSAVTNAAFISRIVDSSAAGTIDLENPDNLSIQGVQRMLVELAGPVGPDTRLATEPDSNTYSSNTGVISGHP